VQRDTAREVDLTNMNALRHPPRARGRTLWILLAILAVICVIVLRPFISPLLWAAFVAYASWPLYRQVRRLCSGRESLAAFVMTALVTLVLVVPFVWLAILLTDEVSRAYQGLMAYRDAGTMGLPPLVRNLPWAGEVMQHAVDRYSADPVLIRTLLIDWAQRLHVELLEMASGIGRNAMKLLTMIVSIFFFYRDGEGVARQAARVIDRFFARRLAHYLETAGAMVKAALLGLLVTAVVQGAIAGIGFALFRVEAPVLLGLLTAVASIIPIVGTFLVWGPASLWLAATGHGWLALGLFMWGLVVVHPSDNILRPLLISTSTQLPFLLVMFGVVGGLAALGLVGLIIGPVVLAVATAVWHEWAD
jgi:predicted PurR-regulated permease PerM